MSIEFFPEITVGTHGRGAMSVHAIHPGELVERVSPIAGVFHSRMRGREFPPHPHAGFSAITYVFDDSPGSLRNRDSLGNDFITAPGGIVWTQAGRGVLHEEAPADPEREMHGVQIFVNLSARHKLDEPRVYHLDPHDVHEWRSAAGDRIRVLVGAFRDVSSPLVPAEPFDLWDVELRGQLSLPLESGRNMLVYVLDGELRVHTDANDRRVATAEHALALHSSGGSATFEAVRPARFLVLSGAALDEPVVFDVHYMMNEPSQLADAAARFARGAMGQLAPTA